MGVLGGHYFTISKIDGYVASGALVVDVRHKGDISFRFATARGRPCFAIVCSDHGTAYEEDGHTGHRVAHEVVWTVPYAEFILHPGQW